MKKTQPAFGTLQLLGQLSGTGNNNNKTGTSTTGVHGKNLSSSDR